MATPELRVRRLLRRWYAAQKRDLPWRNTRNPYRILVSEVMLQQTRVAAVVPYYERFLERFPTAESLAQAAEAEVLAAWAGLGYYSRARNLLRAAKEITAAGQFPNSYAAIRALPGVGEYTAAAVSSIAFGLAYAAVDGNVRRVLGRVFPGGGDPERLLDRKDPGAWNQALMELGATVCLPRAPRCKECPLTAVCAKTVDPVPSKGRRFERIPLALLVIRRGRRTLMQLSPRVAGFWELPEAAAPIPGPTLCTFRHTITHRHYEVSLYSGDRLHNPQTHGQRWVSDGELHSLPVSTMTIKGLRKAGIIKSNAARRGAASLGDS